MTTSRWGFHPPTEGRGFSRQLGKAINALSGAVSLSFAAHRCPASDFSPADTLTLMFIDNGQAQGGNAVNADSVSVARYQLSNAQTYNAAQSTGNTPHQVTITVPAGSLEAHGVAVRAATSYGQISNLMFTCNSSQDSD